MSLSAADPIMLFIIINCPGLLLVLWSQVATSGEYNLVATLFDGTDVVVMQGVPIHQSAKHNKSSNGEAALTAALTALLVKETA